METLKEKLESDMLKAKALKDTLDNLPETLRALNESISKLGEEIKKMQESSIPKNELLKEEINEPKKKKRESDPIPPDFTDIIGKTLNKQFGIELFSRTDAPLMEFCIIVPEKYGTRTPEQKEMMKRDLRVKVISYAEGVNGVREFAEKVYNSFTPEFRSQIVAERIL
jgi:hypothetical protein